MRRRVPRRQASFACRCVTASPPGPVVGSPTPAEPLLSSASRTLRTSDSVAVSGTFSHSQISPPGAATRSDGSRSSEARRSAASGVARLVEDDRDVVAVDRVGQRFGLAGQHVLDLRVEHQVDIAVAAPPLVHELLGGLLHQAVDVDEQPLAHRPQHEHRGAGPLSVQQHVLLDHRMPDPVAVQQRRQRSPLGGDRPRFPDRSRRERSWRCRSASASPTGRPRPRRRPRPGRSRRSTPSNSPATSAECRACMSSTIAGACASSVVTKSTIACWSSASSIIDSRP